MRSTSMTKPDIHKKTEQSRHHLHRISRNLLKTSAEPSYRLSVRTLHPFNHKTVVRLSLTLGTLLAVIMLLGNFYNVNHPAFSWTDLLVSWGLNVLLCYFLFLFNFAIAKRESMETWKRYLYAIVGTLVISSLFALLAKELRLRIVSEVTVTGNINVALFKDISAALVVLLITFLIFNMTRQQNMQLENQRLNEENMRMRYDALVSQLDPHFLFNSLNTLNGLIGEDDDKAHDYVQQLALTYRYIIQTSKLVTLRDDLSFVDSYIYLMQIRYGSNLIIERHILDEAQQRQIVPLSLQLLIENAVKHNVISNKHPLTISITTPDAETIVVRNTICLKQEEPMGERVGLVNLAERYKLVSDRAVEIHRDTTAFEVAIPLLS